MSTVTIFGTGNIGSAVGAVLSAGGAQVRYINTSTADPRVEGDFVVFAVPHEAVSDLITKYESQLAGKVVVDATNPVDFQTLRLTPPADSSATAEIARRLPNSAVLKAFNTQLAQTLVPGSGVVVLIAGDDEASKQALAASIKAGGLGAVDAGALSAARELEAYAFLQIQLVFGGKIASFTVQPSA